MAIPAFPSIEKWVPQKIHAAIGNPPIRLALGRGPEILPAGIEPLASVAYFRPEYPRPIGFSIPKSGLEMVTREGRIEVEGDLVLLMETVFDL